MNGRFKKILRLIPSILFLLGGVQVSSQTRRSHREAFGEPRASIMESLLASLYPTGQFNWNPQLTIAVDGGAPQVVHFPGFDFKPTVDGNVDGATGIEIGDEKQEFIFKSKNIGLSLVRDQRTVCTELQE